MDLKLLNLMHVLVILKHKVLLTRLESDLMQLIIDLKIANPFILTGKMKLL